MVVSRLVRSKRPSSLIRPSLSSYNWPRACTASGVFSRTRFAVISAMSDCLRSTVRRKRSWSLASSIFFESRALTTSSSFSCEVTASQHGETALFMLHPVFALHAQRLDDGLQVEHLVHAARNILAHFVNDEDQGMARPASFSEFIGSFRQFVGVDVRASASHRTGIGIGGGISLRLKIVKHGAGFVQGQSQEGAFFPMVGRGFPGIFFEKPPVCRHPQG